MRPDKLFDYLEGRLPEWERRQIEEQIAVTPQLQQELAMARKIQSGAKENSGEAILPRDEARGRKMALRVGIAFVVLMALNVAIGLIVIARKEASNPNHQLLEKQMREQLAQSLEKAAHSTLTPPPLDVIDVTIPAAPGQLNTVADHVVAIAQRLGGSATKELPDAHSVGVLVDLAADREAQFRSQIAALTGASPEPAASPNDVSGAKKSFVIRIVEPGGP
jgi:hypothetical protein